MSCKVFADADVSTAPVCYSFQYRVIKRLVDVICSAFALILLSPLLVLTALAVGFSSDGSVFYKWHVVGRGSKRFTGHKFRSMIPNADDLKKQLWGKNEMTGPVFKMKSDPRITPVGRVLRKFSIDELPQLWSVLKGDMSLVGPRPVGPREWEHFEDWHKRKLAVKPGMISLWHTSGKPHDFNEWIRLDLEYIGRWSLWLDLKILLLGIPYLFSGKGETITRTNFGEAKRNPSGRSRQ